MTLTEHHIVVYSFASAVDYSRGPTLLEFLYLLNELAPLIIKKFVIQSLGTGTMEAIAASSERVRVQSFCMRDATTSFCKPLLSALVLDTSASCKSDALVVT